MTTHNVCSNSPLKAKHGSTVTLENHTKNDIVVKDNGNPNTWPFSDVASGFTILAGGTAKVVLKTTPGTYYYRTEFCPDDKEVNPKTVIIT
jgi:hypothetical protein